MNATTAAPNAQNKLLTMEDVCARLDMPKGTLKRLLQDREDGPPFMRMGLRSYILESTFNAWLTARQAKALVRWARAVTVQSEIKAGRL
jgi:predicted DNA-binding transcriptional regulator AlpA